MSVRSAAWTIYRQALPILIVSLLGGLFAGLVLEDLVPKVADFPGLLVMIPVFLATRGNVYAALGGRISSGLHQGLIEPQFTLDDRLVNAIIASLVNAIGISIVIAVLTWTVLRGLGRDVAALHELVAIMLIAGVLTSVVLVAGLLGVIFVGFERGYDPDNLVGPVVTTIGDIFGMLFLLLAVLSVEVFVP